MVAVTYGARTARAIRKIADNTASHRGWFARFVDALIEVRMQQARREIARHAHLLPYTLDERGNRLVKIDRENAPFGGW
jgi:hypothetical protein